MEILLDVVVEKNLCLQKVHVEFGEDGRQLENSLACNRKKWMERLTDNGQGETNSCLSNQLSLFLPCSTTFSGAASIYS
jgi:hypothetical protein